MSVSAKGKQEKQVRQLQCQEQCIYHIPYYLSGLSRAVYNYIPDAEGSKISISFLFKPPLGNYA